MTLLRVNQLTKNFGGLCAVSNVSMNIEEGELIGLIGPNGAGKTTFFNLLTGVYEPSDGTIELNINGKMTSIGGLKHIASRRWAWRVPSRTFVCSNR